MTFKTIKSICFSCFALLLIFYPSKIDALSPEWVSVPKSQYGEQLWDKNSVQKNQDGSIRVFSKFIPKSTTDISQDILYTMDINCSENSFSKTSWKRSLNLPSYDFKIVFLDEKYTGHFLMRP